MKELLIAVKGPVATLTLARPNKMNALTPRLVQELRSAVDELQEDAQVRAVIINGKGRAFCAGADLEELAACRNDSNKLRRFILEINDAFDAIEAARFPVIAEVHGLALAGGFELLLACDLAVVAEGAWLGDQHINMGVLAGAGGSQRLPRRVGPLRAAEFIYRGNWVDGRRAEEIGLVNRAVPAEELPRTVQDLAEELARKSPILEWSKYLMRVGRGMPLAEAIDLEVEIFLQEASSPNFYKEISTYLSERETDAQASSDGRPH